MCTVFLHLSKVVSQKSRRLKLYNDRLHPIFPPICALKHVYQRRKGQTSAGPGP